MDPLLLDHITIPTDLEPVLLTSVLAGRDVVIAGTAGSGKTHLLQRLASQLSPVPTIPFGDAEPRRGRFVRIVPDLTALPPTKWEHVFRRPRHCQAVVVAANEGTLLSAAREEPASGNEDERKFSVAVRSLHLIQRGQEQRDENLTVIDAAGYDPTTSNALADMLALPLLGALIETSDCPCRPESCPRRKAWRMLSDAKVRDRLAALIRAAAVGAEGFTFRLLWTFVADIALGGSCTFQADHHPPTSPWYWRVFAGGSEVALAIEEAFPLSQFPMPSYESRMWYGDWNWLQLDNRWRQTLPPMMVPPKRPSELSSVAARQSTFLWLKAQALYGLSEDFGGTRRTVADTSALWVLAEEGNVPGVIRALNRYMTYGLGAAATELELWIDYAVERRLRRPDTQVSLGRVTASAFRIARSLAATASEGITSIPAGHRLFLRHDQSGASLPLTREALATIAAGRSSRTVDREHTETEWLLMRFFADIAGVGATINRLRVMHFDFDSRRCAQVDWDVHPETPAILLASAGAQSNG